MKFYLGIKESLVIKRNKPELYLDRCKILMTIVQISQLDNEWSSLETT